MKSDEVSKLGKHLWKSSNLIAEDVRGALGGLCTLWNEKEVRLEHHFNSNHWILTRFYHMQRNSILTIINVYMSINPSEKSECWRSLADLKSIGIIKNGIIVGDLNIIRTSAKKKGGIFGRDPF
jgi:hypothetical protein